MAALRESLRDLRRFLFGSWPRGVFGAWFCLLMLAFVKNAIAAEKVSDRVMALGVLTTAASTFVFWVCRHGLKRAVGNWQLAPGLRFVIIGGLGGVWAEFLFWAYQTAFGITGVAANANFGLDLAVTMPWYLLMLALLWRVVTRRAYAFRELALLGGVYDMCADGLLRQTIGGAVSLQAAALDVVVLPMFIVAYSIMVLPACVLLADDIARIRDTRPQRPRGRLLYGLLPVTGLVPYTVMLIVAGGGLWK